MGRCCVRTWQLLPVCETSFEPLRKDPLFFYSLCFIGLPQDRLQGRCWALGGGVCFAPKLRVCRDLEEKQQEADSSCSAFAAESLRLPSRTHGMCPASHAHPLKL